MLTQEKNILKIFKIPKGAESYSDLCNKYTGIADLAYQYHENTNIIEIHFLDLSFSFPEKVMQLFLENLKSIKKDDYNDREKTIILKEIVLEKFFSILKENFQIQEIK